MKKFVVAYLSFFDNVIVQHLVEAENNYEAVKKFMVMICSDDSRQSEIDFQASADYPKTFEELDNYYYNADSVISVLELE